MSVITHSSTRPSTRKLRGSGVRRAAARVRATAEAGMSTAEYAVGTVAAVSFAAVLIAVVRSDAVRAALSSIVTNALNVS